MASNDYGSEARDRVVDDTLDLIDDLDVHQARSILRCFAIDEENFDARALTTITTTIRATRERSRNDYDAQLHFPNNRVARLNREHLIKSRAKFADAEKSVSDTSPSHNTQFDIASADLWWAQKAAEDAQRSAQTSQASMHIPCADDDTDEGYYDQQRGTTDGTTISDPSNPRFEDADTERSIRGRHVTINHYYMGKGPEVQPQPEPKLDWLYCVRCNDYYVEEDNVVQSDGAPPCGYHSGTCLPKIMSTAALAAF